MRCVALNTEAVLLKLHPYYSCNPNPEKNFEDIFWKRVIQKTVMPICEKSKKNIIL